MTAKPAPERPQQIHWFETLSLMNVTLAMFESAAMGDGWLPMLIFALTFSGLIIAIARGRSRIACWLYSAIFVGMFGLIATAFVFVTINTGVPRYTPLAGMLSLLNLGLNVGSLALLWSKPSRNWLRKAD